MEAAIRWSPHSTSADPRFVLVDVARHQLRLGRFARGDGKTLQPEWESKCERGDGLPPFTAFDWSKTTEHVVGIGARGGHALVINLDPELNGRPGDRIIRYAVKNERTVNSIAFSASNLLATGLDRVRNDGSLNVYDLHSTPSPGRPSEPYRKLASSEAVTSLKFFNQQPETLIAGVSRQSIRLYDLRDPTGAVAQVPTRQVHNLAIDPLDENLFISAGPVGEPSVSVWDRRYFPQGPPGTPSGNPPGPALDFRTIVDDAQSTSIWSLRFSGTKRGTFGVLSSAGEIRVIELGQHTGGGVSSSTVSANPLGGSAWSNRTYARHIHNVTWPWYETEHRHDENSRVIACDFMSVGNPLATDALLTLHPDRTVDVHKIPTSPLPLKMTATDDLYNLNPGHNPVHSTARYPTITGELDELQLRTISEYPLSLENSTSTIDAQMEALRIQQMHNRVSGTKSSQAAHCQLLQFGFPSAKLPFTDTLRMLGVQRRRCLEGYSLNIARNKEIVANDRWLVELWENVKRFQTLAKDNGMVMDGIDMSYIGIFSILNNSLGMHYKNRLLGSEKHAETSSIRVAIKDLVSRKGYPAFKGEVTAFPEHRQLCLALCNWTFHKERLRARCTELIEAGDCYRAIAMCVFRGYKDLALDLLKLAIQQKRVQNVGLGAVIAVGYVNDDQQDEVRWMSDEADDAYLKAMLEYFITGDWSTVANMTQLALIDRLGVALKYFEDGPLQDFVKWQMSEAIVYSNIEGILLTGLTDKGMDLFEHYIRKYNDIQTPVLVMAHSVPLYLRDPRFDAWKETYFMQMQAWKAFTQRTRFTVMHNRMSLARDNRQFNKPPARPVTLRCLHCQQSLAYHPQKTVTDDDGDTATITSNVSRPGNTPSINAGTVCPQCKRPMPRCGICMLWLGSPDPAKPGGAAALAEKTEGKSGEMKASERMIVWCMKCTHGFHGGHARDWFARHKICAIPDCGCVCGVLH